MLGLEANPAVILPCADVDAAVKECAAGALGYNGQRCTAIEQIFVHESLAEAFVAKLGEAVDGLVAGMPWEAGVALTPLPEAGKPRLSPRRGRRREGRARRERRRRRDGHVTGRPSSTRSRAT